MEERKIVNVYVTYDRRQYSQVGIPMDINEVELKALLRDLGYISSYRQAYFTTEVYLESDDKSELTEICLDKYRTLEELGIVENCLIVIKPGNEPQPKTEVVYRSRGSMRCLYGCPMAHSVEEAMNQAEKYSDDDSNVIEGIIE